MFSMRSANYENFSMNEKLADQSVGGDSLRGSLYKVATIKIVGEIPVQLKLLIGRNLNRMEHFRTVINSLIAHPLLISIQLVSRRFVVHITNT